MAKANVFIVIGLASPHTFAGSGTEAGFLHGDFKVKVRHCSGIEGKIITKLNLKLLL